MVHPLEGLSEGYLKEKDYSQRTLKHYRIAFKYFINYLKEQEIMHAKTSDVLRYRAYRRRLGHSSHYIYVGISALKGLYHYLRINRRRLNLPASYDYNIMEGIKNERIKQGIKKPILTVIQAKQLLLHTKRNHKYLWHYRDHAIVSLMMTSGLRGIEIVHVKRRDYQVRKGKAVLYLKRGEKDESYVKIASGVRQAIDQYLALRNDDNPYLFIAHKNASPKNHLSRTFFIHMFRRVLEGSGLEKEGITPHCLRHTAAALNLLRGGSISQTKELMRHKDIQSTFVYSDHIARMQDDSEAQIEAFILREEETICDLDLLVHLWQEIDEA